MKITIVGSGAVGSLFGSILHKGGQDVTFVDIKKEHIEKMKTRGLLVERPDGEEILKVKATTDITEGGTPDLIIFAVKSYDNITAANDCLKVLGDDTIVLTVQNGIGNYETIGEIVGKERIITGTTDFGSTVTGPGSIRPSLTGSLSIGELSGEITPRFEKLNEELTKSGFIIHPATNVDNLIWTKLIVNIGINAIAAIIRVTNGKIQEIEYAKDLSDRAVEEAVKVAEAKGIEFVIPDVKQYVRDVCKSTYGNNASMLQDVLRGDKTEVRSINGAIVEEGKKYNIEAPVNDVLTKLVCSIEGRLF